MVRGIFGVLLVACSLSCGQGQSQSPVPCLAYAAAGLRVEVTNAATAQPICDATVTAREGAYSERLGGTTCSYIGAYERPGTYVVTAARPGFVPKEVSLVRVAMGGGACPHVEQVRVTIALAPEG